MDYSPWGRKESDVIEHMMDGYPVIQFNSHFRSKIRVHCHVLN